MKAWIISDIHLFRMGREPIKPPFPVPVADVCICPGDVASDIETAIDYLTLEVCPVMPVIYVLGNHDYFGTTIYSALARARRMAAGYPLYVLENAAIVHGGIRFIGATLWTDYAVKIGDDSDFWPEQLRIDVALKKASKMVPDFDSIHSEDGPGVQVSVDEFLGRHYESRAFIETELAKPFQGKTVVVTHHLPSPRSIHPDFLGNISNAAYASDLTELIQRGKPDLWVHGHTHNAFDYREGATRILCNPRGFSNERYRNGFVPDLIIDLEADI